MNGSRGAKGSVNDRLISMMYRHRYMEYMKKMRSYNKNDRTKVRDYLKNIRSFDIDNGARNLDDEDRTVLEETLSPLNNIELSPTPKMQNSTMENVSTKAQTLESKPILTPQDISMLVNLGHEVTSFDPEKEDYDFDNYDYYEVISTKTPIGIMPQEEIIDVDKEIAKREDEIVIFDEVTKFIDESKELLGKIKTEIAAIKGELDNQHTKEDIEHLEERYNALQEKIDKLKAQYLAMKEKYEFEDYGLLESIPLITAISDYRDKARLEELETLVDACKEEVDEVSSVLEEDEHSHALGNDIEAKEEDIVDRDASFKQTKENVIYLDDFEKQIMEEAMREQKIIAELWNHLSKIETEIVKKTEYVHQTGRMLASFLRITAGILTRPLTNYRLFGVMLGTGLINRGLTDLRASLTPKKIEKTRIKEKYQSIEQEIFKTQDAVTTTMKLIDDSLEQISDLKETFKTRFAPYAEYIPNYREVETMLNQLEKDLVAKKAEEKSMRETLNKQYDLNKQKVLRAS